jgi:hypothetical protein
MTMNIRTTSFASLLAVLAACGSGDSETHTLTSGTYAVSSATGGTAPDTNPECSGLLASYQVTPAKTLTLTVSGTTAASIDTGGTPGDDTLPTVTITANALDTGTTGTRTITGSGTSGTCNVDVTKTFSGSITADNTAELTYTFKAVKQAASDTCDDTNSVILPIPCSSAIHFLATKQE